MANIMEDPRIAELLEYVDAVDKEGNPTPLALIARRVKTYLEAVQKLRVDLSGYHSKVESFETRAENLSKAMEDRKSQRGDLNLEAQEAAVRAAFSTTSRGVHLRKEAEAKHRDLKQFDQDFEQNSKRLKEVMRALENNRKMMVETRDQIARRMNIVDALLQRAEIEWPSYYMEENKRTKKPGQAGQPLRRRRRAPARRVVVRRRAS